MYLVHETRRPTHNTILITASQQENEENIRIPSMEILECSQLNTCTFNDRLLHEVTFPAPLFLYFLIWVFDTISHL